MNSLRNNFNAENVFAHNFVFLNPDEQELVRSWRNNENITKWLYTEHIILYDEHQKFLNNLKNDNRNYYWLVKDENSFLGAIYFNRVDFENKNAYLGIYTNPEKETKGAGVILGKLLIYLAFKIFNLHTLKLEVLEDNVRAINFYKKLGFKEEGNLREFVFKSNQWKDVIIMGIVNDE